MRVVVLLTPAEERTLYRIMRRGFSGMSAVLRAALHAYAQRWVVDTQIKRKTRSLKRRLAHDLP